MFTLVRRPFYSKRSCNVALCTAIYNAIYSSRFFIHYVSKSGRPSGGHRTEKGQSSSQLPRRVIPKNVLNTRQSHSSLMLVRTCIKSCGHYVKQELPDVQGGFRKGRGTRDQIVNIRWIIEKAMELQEKKSISLSSTMLKSLTVWIMRNCGKLLERWEYQTLFLVS